jgi:quercetin dioxygenase-like cupin family protein
MDGMDTMHEAQFCQEMDAAGYPVSIWANGPQHRYGTHTHPYRKLLCCLEGSIIFHTASGDQALGPGDRLVLDAGIEHSATVGPDGVRCAEAHAG